MDQHVWREAPAEVRLAGETGQDAAAMGVRVERHWEGHACWLTVRNDGAVPVAVAEVALCAASPALAPETRVYGEGFQMLSQTAGTLASPVDVGGYTDRGHYRLPQPEGALTVYSLALLTSGPPAGTGDSQRAGDARPRHEVPSPGPPAGAEHCVMAFASCKRFAGSFRFFPEHVEAVLDTEGLTLAPGASWALETFWCAAGGDREALLAALAEQVGRHHPRLEFAPQPAGWCSWYWYGPRVSEADILDNLCEIAAHRLPLRYVQIDDGYQAAMGDWLTPGPRFPRGLPALCQEIRAAGFEPAIWVAPFIAERDSRLAREHPEWLVHDGGGRPLASDAVSFGGWRHGPWYMLDGTHPGAQAYLEDVFRTMREDWGCHYFKLDALTWGALPGGRRFDPTATRVEAYRRGMAAVHRGAGAGSFVLGCNAPMWASLGLVHGMRVSRDIKRTWPVVSAVAQECFFRNWQHGRLWANDPDCTVLAGLPGRPPLADDEYRFHAAAVYASGGLVLSGDSVPHLTPERRAMLAKLASSAGTAAQFEDTTWRSGVIRRPEGEVRCLFNWGDAPEQRDLAFDHGDQAIDFWSGEPLHTSRDRTGIEVAPHSARLIWLTPPGAG